MKEIDKELIRELIEDNSIYEDIRYKRWRGKIFKRDGHSCQFPDCKWPQGKLNAHHIHMKWYHPEWIFKLTNGIALCEYHHKYIHKKGSKDFIDLFEAIAYANTENPKISKRARNISKKSAKRRLIGNRKKKKKRIVRLVKNRKSLVRVL
jgi:hypothetical protein